MWYGSFVFLGYVSHGNRHAKATLRVCLGGDYETAIDRFSDWKTFLQANTKAVIIEEVLSDHVTYTHSSEGDDVQDKVTVLCKANGVRYRYSIPTLLKNVSIQSLPQTCNQSGVIGTPYSMVSSYGKT